jgi:glycosyltransferase involved in cell wall biosynthesis
VKILYHHRTQAEDGQAVHIRALQEAFRELGHDVVEVGLVQRSGASAGPSRWGFVSRLPRFARELAEYAYTPVGRGRILAAARRERPDFVYERHAFGNAAGVMAARRHGLPLVLEVNPPKAPELGRTRGLVFERTGQRFEAWVLRSATLVCTVTEVLAAMLVELGVARERLLVTPNGVHLGLHEHADRAEARRAARADLQLSADALVLGFVGYYRDWHRLDLVVEALPSLPRAELVLVGEGPARADLERRAQAAGVAQRVRFAAPRRDTRIPALLPACDVALVRAVSRDASRLRRWG